MKKRKVQSVIFYCDTRGKKQFLLLRVNKLRGLFWQNSTGAVEDDESFEQAAVREASEETGLLKSNIEKIYFTDFEFEFLDRWNNNVIEKVFIIEAKEAWEIQLDPEEHIEFKWENEKDISKESVKFETNYLALNYSLELPCE